MHSFHLLYFLPQPLARYAHLQTERYRLYVHRYHRQLFLHLPIEFDVPHNKHKEMLLFVAGLNEDFGLDSAGRPLKLVKCRHH